MVVGVGWGGHAGNPRTSQPRDMFKFSGVCLSFFNVLDHHLSLCTAITDTKLKVSKQYSTPSLDEANEEHNRLVRLHIAGKGQGGPPLVMLQY